MPFRIRTLNAISQVGLSRLPGDKYTVGHDVTSPDALLVRSASLHNQPIEPSVLAVARAGAGTNNIPIAEFFEWVKDLGSTLLIEFPKRTDPMVRALLAEMSARPPLGGVQPDEAVALGAAIAMLSPTDRSRTRP